MPDSRRQIRGYRAQRKGKTGEEIAEMLLRARGVQMVEKIATPYVIYERKGEWVKIARTGKVSGDRRGIMPDGRRVLAEVKSRDRNLRWTDLEDHQVDALNENNANNGVSLLVWIHNDFNVIMRWPIKGFGPRKSVKAETVYRHLSRFEWNGVD